MQPKNFGFGEDETMLRDSARRLLADQSPVEAVHALVAANPDPHRAPECLWDRDLWQQMVELGWTAVCVPESAGGIGMPLVAAVALAEEIGRAACPSPLIATLNSSAVLGACANGAANAALAEIAAGKATSLAITGASGSWNPEDSDVAVNADGTLTGSAHFVQDAGKAQQFVVSARGEGGIGLYLVDAQADGLRVIPDRIIDLTRDQAHLEFANAPAREMAAPGAGGMALRAAWPALLCLVSADMVGAGEWLLQTTVEYAKTRVQFDRPLGFFQAIKHPLVNVMLEIDRAKSLTYDAGCAYDSEPSEAERFARMAKSQASDMAVFASSRAVQFHGGIGFTWECFVHLYFKRQMHNQVLFGDGRYQRKLLAEMVIGEAA